MKIGDKRLAIWEADVVFLKITKSGSSDVVVDKDAETLVLVFDEALDVGDVLGCLFCRLLERLLAGLMLTYVDGGVRKNMAVTQFKPVDARRCFPCWDQPALKASDALKFNMS
ncbi:aminopeptidase M1-like protein isoform X1 [Tanacetum coccineum]